MNERRVDLRELVLRIRSPVSRYRHEHQWPIRTLLVSSFEVRDSRRNQDASLSWARGSPWEHGQSA